MTLKEMEAGRGHTPATEENSATVYSNVPNLYIHNPSCIDKEFLELQQHPLVKDFANVSEDTYKLVAHTNPTLKLLFDVCRGIVAEARP